MRLLDIFSRKFWKKDRQQNRQQLLLGDSETRSTMKRFDIVVISDDEDGQHQRTENGICGQSAQQLTALYAATGERIQILREYDDPSMDRKPIEAKPQNVKVEQTVPQNIELSKISPSSVPPAKPYVPTQKKAPPKFFTICGTECKFDDGKIYQKQWVKILGNEALQYRLISDSNNKEISLNGKHLEMLKWVLVQDESENADTSLNTSIMQILNG